MYHKLHSVQFYSFYIPTLIYHSFFVNIAVLAIQAKKKRKNPKGRKSGNAGKEDVGGGPPTPGGGTRENAANNGQSRETRSAQPR